MTSENEWGEAAYFDGARYYAYPAGSDTEVDCAAPGAAPNCESARAA